MTLALKCEGLGKRYQLGEKSDVYTLTDWLGRRLLGREAKSVEESKNTIWALKNLDFELEAGQVLGIVGRNGSGKSTLLKILSRITPPSTGHFGYKGSMASLLEVGTGFKQELSGLDNIYLSGTSLGLRRQDIREKIDEIIAFAEIEEFIHTPVKRYSSGMYVRLAFAVAAHLEPDILLLDEVLAVGDQKFQRKCLSKMKSVAGEGRTVLFVSHNMQAVTQLCTQALLLDKGVCVSHGGVEEVVKAYHDHNREAGEAMAVRTFEKPSNSNGAWIKSIQLGRKDNPSSVVDIMEPLQIEVEMEVDDDHGDLILNLNVRSEEGMILFSSRDPDGNNATEGQDKVFIVPTPKGRYRYKASLPSPLLNTGFYELQIALIGEHRVVLDQKRNVFVEVQDLKGSFSSCIDQRRAHGEVVAPINWIREKD